MHAYVQGPCLACVPNREDTALFPRCVQCGGETKTLFRVFKS